MENRDEKFSYTYSATQKGIEILIQMKNIYQTEKEVLDRWLGN